MPTVPFHLRSLALATTIATIILALATTARAGGYDEAPPQGAQALGRGGAFTAKADDATALHYNVAGLAAQRGTKVLLGANLQAGMFEFHRAGRYPGDPEDPATRYAGQPYPVVRNVGSPKPLPMFVVTTDLGTDRLTLAAGVLAPTANAGKQFPGIVEGAPSPARYDTVTSGSSLIVFPTLAAAYAVTPEILVGVAGHAAIAKLDVTNIAYVDKGSCKSAEDPRCDAKGHVVVEGASFGGAVGALAKISPSVQLGAQVRTGTTILAEGRSQTTTPASLGATKLPPSETKLELALPWTLRTGARYVSYDGSFEAYDLELDFTYEAWGGAQAGGPRVWIADAGLGKPSTVESFHGWQDTFGVRAGGAHNFEMRGGAVLSFRGGAYFESSATPPENTRIDVDTLEKVGSAFGIGLRSGAFAFDVAYAATASIPRTVSGGRFVLRNAGADDAAGGGAGPVLNDGVFRGFSHTVAASVEVNLSRLFGGSPAADEDATLASWSRTRPAPSSRPRRASASAR